MRKMTRQTINVVGIELDGPRIAGGYKQEDGEQEGEG